MQIREQLKTLLFKQLKKISLIFWKTGFKIDARFFPIYWFFYRVLKPSKPATIIYENIKFSGLLSDTGVFSVLSTLKAYENFEITLFKSMLKQNMNVIDAGANFGFYSLIAAKEAPEGKIYSFEPDPINFSLLKHNIEQNGFKNIIPFQVALSDKLGKATLFTNKYNLGDHSISVKNITYPQGKISVDTTTLDQLMETHKIKHKVDIIKIDVQGADALVIKGAMKLLKSNNVKVFLEFWPIGLLNTGSDPRELINQLTKLSFKIKYLDTKERRLIRVTADDLLKICAVKAKQFGKVGSVDLYLEKMNLPNR